ncbi:MAG: hypothetical protein WDW36_007329 [Sanguina aurantia]
MRSVLVWALLGAVAHTQAGSQAEPRPPPDPARCASCEGAPARDAPRFSLHSCVGETNTLRSCHFRDLYLRLEDRQWVYFQCPDDPPRTKIAGHSVSSTSFSEPSAKKEDRYYLQDSFIRWGSCVVRSDVAFTPAVHTGCPPAAGLVHDIPGVSVMWEFVRLSSYSYGHCLLNDWFPMFLTMSSHLGRLPRRFNVISHSSPLSANTAAPGNAHACNHYVTAWSKAPVQTLEDVVQQAASLGASWVRFRDVVVGEAGHASAAAHLTFSNHANPSTPSVFNTQNWRSFRDSVYGSFQLPLPSTEDTSGALQQSIVIVARPKGDVRRVLLNQEELAAHLTLTFPDAITRVVEFSQFTPLEQLQITRNTTVLISLQGSSSFRLVFLGKGARVISVGSPTEYWRRITNDWHYTSFFEIPKYFQTADFKFLKYAVDSGNASEFVLGGPPGAWQPDYYDASVRVDLKRMEGLVRQALWECSAENGWQVDLS